MKHSLVTTVAIVGVVAYFAYQQGKKWMPKGTVDIGPISPSAAPLGAYLNGEWDASENVYGNPYADYSRLHRNR